MYSSYQYSSFYTTPHLYLAPTQNYCEQLKSVCHKLVPYWPYAIVPIGFYGICKLFGYLIPGPHRQVRLKLKDKTVLLIGASSGVGRALAFEFYAKGAKVILTARGIDKLEEFCKELVQWGKDRGVENAHQPSFRYLDVSELNGGDDGAAQIRELVTYSIDGKTVDVLVNCAGLSSRGSIMETPLAVHRRLMEINFFGFISITKVLMDCIPDDGAILNINSVQGRVALPFRSPYSCSKHAIQAFFDSLRGEERPQLQILTVNASYIDTGFGSRAINPQGKPMGIEDHNQQRGYTAEYAARQIICALECRKTELVLAPFHIRLVIFLRWIAPNLLWWLLRRKGVANNKRDQKALEEAKKEK